MEKREDALREALTTNELETQKWQSYKAENETAIANLDMFLKKLSVEVMVPIGTKAFMPGELIHTNEVLVGHFQGYFSKCSAHKAKEICTARVRMADEQLKKYEKEAELWLNKLEKPYHSGALPNSNEIDIVEEYDEERENKWRVEHAAHMKKWKQKEKLERDKLLATRNEPNEIEFLMELEQELSAINGGGEIDEDIMQEILNKKNIKQDFDNYAQKNAKQESAETKLKTEIKADLGKAAKEQPETVEKVDAAKASMEDIFKILEEAEKREQENDELNKLEVNEECDTLVRQLMAAEQEVPKTKQRVAHKKTDKATKTAVEKPNNIKSTQNETAKMSVSKKSVSNENYKDNNEIENIKKEAEYLPLNDQVQFYEYHIQILKNKMLKETKDIKEKERLLTLVCDLEDVLDELLDYALTNNQLDDIITESEDEKNADSIADKKRRISFALSEETIEFRHNETVAEMLPKTQETFKPQRDVITLDTPITTQDNTEAPVNRDNERKQRIRENVDKCFDYVKENQSTQDFDMVTNILNSLDNKIKTLHITFKHSDQKSYAERGENTTIDESMPYSPADFYTYYEKAKAANEQTTPQFPIYVNSYEGEDEVKAPLLSESKRNEAYENPRAAFSKPDALDANAEDTKPALTKSILRNKSAVERETHIKPKKKKKINNMDAMLDNMSAYNKVMKDISEKAPTVPETLPDCKFIDAHTPKKRISRFKLSRANEKI